MDEEIERLLVSVRADTGAFARDVAEMRGQLDGPLAEGAERAGRVLEHALLRAVRTGKFGFEDLKRTALAAMAEIAANAMRSGLQALGGGGGAAGLAGAAGRLVAGLAGAPGRATGGPVAPGRAYLVGERGPELFVPTASGRVEPGGPGGAREVRVTIAINAPQAREPEALRASGRQVARAVRQALMRGE
ncbi:MAG: tail tape measure protein [Allosphingosinicella sp.]|uniref:tail tape measure protein n=1 Tax=Allosphingosinicella sp. TaxID=2823234 RepID=UPI00395BFF01